MPKRITKPRVQPTVKPSPKPSPTVKPSSSKETSPTPLLFPTADAFETWLTTNHLTSPGIWLRLAKKSSPTPAPSYDEALTIALCHGWIDGQRKTFSAHHFIQRFTPRRKNSLWSKRNVQKVEALIREGRMKEQGLKEVERAQEDGRWGRAYGGSRDMEMGEDFRGVLEGEGNEGARRFWDGLGRSQRYSVLWRVETVKEEGRRAKIEQMVEMLGRGEVP